MLSPLSGILLPLGFHETPPSSGVSYGTPTLDLDFSGLGLADNDPIGSITNAGSAGGSFTAAGSTRPTFRTAIQNGKSVARFDGTDDVLVGSALSAYFGASAKTLFVVGRFTGGSWPATTNWQAPAFLADSGGYLSLAANVVTGPANEFLCYNYDGGYDYAHGSTSRTINQWYCLTLWHDGTDLKCQVDTGTLASTASVATSSMAGTTQVGKSYSNYLTGDVGRILGYSTALGTTDRETYRDQLITEWGI